MRYFANASSHRVREAMVRGEIGMIATPAEGRDPGGLHVDPDCARLRCVRPDHRRPAQVWCADNGCGPGRAGVAGAGYPGDEAWLAWLQRLSPHASRCVFATAPDVVGDADATLERSRPHLPAIRALGYPVALVAQDGLEDRLDDPAVRWAAFDAVFLGGSTGWKLGPGAARVTRAAHERGKRVHMGRVNNARRYSYAQLLGWDSADGTFLAHGPDMNLARLRGWMAAPPLPLDVAFDTGISSDDLYVLRS